MEVRGNRAALPISPKNAEKILEKYRNVPGWKTGKIQDQIHEKWPKDVNLDTPGAANRARASGLDTSGSKTWEKYKKNTRKHSNFETQSAATREMRGGLQPPQQRATR